MTVPKFADRRCAYYICAKKFTPKGHNHRFCTFNCAHMSQAKTQVEKWQDKRSKQKAAIDELQTSKCRPTATGEPLGTIDGVEAHRKLDCASYDACLDVAAMCEWSGFVCDNCADGYQPKPITREEIIRLSNLGHAIDLIPGLTDE